jgi:very-short-patch-repair endonuclease
MDQNEKYVTSQAKKLQKVLEDKGIQVESEHYDGYKHVDLYLPEARVNIEVDGLWHLTNPQQIIRDFNREYHDDRKGFNTLHIQNVVIDHHLDEIVKGIVEMVLIRKLEFLAKK